VDTIQLTDVISEILALPEWAPKLILLILVVGFVPALILAWAFELTPEGVKLEKDVVRGPRRSGCIWVCLSRAMNDNPELRVLVQQGYYDLATPAFAAEYMMDHLTIARQQQENITVELYDSRHMMYLHPPSLVKYKKDLANFTDND
jgi:hypothetical protein